MLEKILLDAAILKAHPTRDNNSDVHRSLASVCVLWKDIVDGDQFYKMFCRGVGLQCQFLFYISISKF